jgi:MFS transporter, DHA3 family, tetracycline resistance protein
VPASSQRERVFAVGTRGTAAEMSMHVQADAIGQVVGGPPLGALANRTSLATALVATAVILSPTALVYLRLRPAVTATTGAPDPDGAQLPAGTPPRAQLPNMPPLGG